jgi:hypothetical protein
MIILGFYARSLDPGTLGRPVSLLACFGRCSPVMAPPRSRDWQSSVRANAPLVLAIGLMTGAGFMYVWMMTAALNQPSTTGAALSALMWPAVPFYIVLNSAIELMLVCLLVFGNWDTGRRRMLIVASIRCLRRDVRMDPSRLCRDALGHGLTHPIPGGDRIVQADARQGFSHRPQHPCLCSASHRRLHSPLLRARR